MKKITTFLFAFTALVLQVKAQSVSSNPNNGRRLDRMIVKVTGINTNFNTGSNTLQFFRNGTTTNFLKIDGLNPTSATEMDVNLFIQSSATIGNYSYIVSNPAFGNASSTNFFVVRPDTGTARILSIFPNQLQKGLQFNRVLVKAQNTHFLQASNTSITVFKNGSPTIDHYASLETPDNNTMVYMYLQTSNDALGFYDIEFKNNYETIYVADALEVSYRTGLNEQNLTKESVKVYPNPAKENLSIQTTKEPIEAVSLYTLTGALVQTETPAIPIKNLEIKLSDMLLSKQIYLLRIKTKSGVFHHKIQID